MWGKCLADLPEDVPSLIDVDGIGVLCDPCVERGPPHYEYLKKILGAKLGDVANLVESIAEFAYEECC